MKLPKEDLYHHQGYLLATQTHAVLPRGTYCLAEDDVPSERQHQALGQAVRKFLKEHEGQGLLGSAHHFSHAVLQGTDEGIQLFIPVLCREEGGVRTGGQMKVLGMEPGYSS